MAKTKTAEGRVVAISKKYINTKGKKRPVYAICIVDVDDEDGEDGTWYRTKFDKPACDKGDVVEFEYEKTKYGLEIDTDTLEVTEEGPGDDEEEEEEKPKRKKHNGKKGTTKTSAKTSTSREAYWERKEQRDLDNDIIITYAAARNAAYNYVTKLVELGVLDVGKQQKRKLEKVDAYVEKYTDQFFTKASSAEELRAKLTKKDSDDDDDVVDENDEEEEESEEEED